MRYPLQILSVLLTLCCSGLWGSSLLPARDKLILHLSADRGVERNYRDGISRWTDQSGGLEFIVPPEQLSPVFKPAALNGHGVIHFQGRSLLRSTRALQGLDLHREGMTLVVVARTLDNRGKKALVNLSPRDGDRSGGFSLSYDLEQSTGVGSLGLEGPGNNATVAFGSQLHNGDFAVFSLQILAGSGSAERVRIYKNGRHRYLNRVGQGFPIEPGGDPGLVVEIGGSSGSPTGAGFHVGDIAQILIYGEALSADEREALERDLGRRYGLETAPTGSSLRFATRFRQPDLEGGFQVQSRKESWNPAKTAAIVVDMWDDHHCLSAARRVVEMAPHMDRVLASLRQRGVLIIHAPSATMDFYQGHPARTRAQQAAHHEAPLSFQWNDPNLKCEAPLPGVQAGCSCDTEKVCAPSYRAWTRQIQTIAIKDPDVISDDGQEIFNVLKSRSIENLLIMGVHTNVCVLGRPFGIRQMVYVGKNVVLVRDLTDTYNRAPGRHFAGISRTVAHIEKYWAPTTSSTFLTGLPEFRFEEDPRPHVVFLVGEKEYQTGKTLPELAVQELEPRGLRFSFVHADAENIHRFPGIEVLDSADLLVLSVRRRNPPEEQLAVIRKYLEAGRPLVGIRTSSHGFGLRDQQPSPPGHAAWPSFDREVLGGTYHGHHGSNTLDSPRFFFWVIPEASAHPVLKGLPAGEIQTRSWLYKHLPLADEARPLLMGRVGKRLPHEPVAWVHSYGQSRVFYTSLGHPRDFDLPVFRRLLVNGIFWALSLEVPEPEEPSR